MTLSIVVMRYGEPVGSVNYDPPVRRYILKLKGAPSSRHVTADEVLSAARRYGLRIPHEDIVRLRRHEGDIQGNMRALENQRDERERRGHRRHGHGESRRLAELRAQAAQLGYDLVPRNY